MLYKPQEKYKGTGEGVEIEIVSFTPGAQIVAAEADRVNTYDVKINGKKARMSEPALELIIAPIVIEKPVVIEAPKTEAKKETIIEKAKATVSKAVKSTKKGK